MRTSREGEAAPSRASSTTGQEAEVVGQPGETRESWEERKGQRRGVNPSQQKRGTRESQLQGLSYLLQLWPARAQLLKPVASIKPAAKKTLWPTTDLSQANRA